MGEPRLAGRNRDHEGEDMSQVEVKGRPGWISIYRGSYAEGESVG